MNIFDRAARGVWLSPFERAALRLLEGIAVSALVAGLTAVVPYLAGSSIDWTKVAQVFVATAISAMLLSLLKYAKAFGDQPLPLPPFSSVRVSSPNLPVRGEGPEQGPGGAGKTGA